MRNLGPAEGKYFTTFPASASFLAKQAALGFGDSPYTLIQTHVSKNVFEGLFHITVDRAIPTWVIPDE